MNTYSFEILLDREPSDDELDTLYECGLSDASVETRDGGTTAWLVCERDSSSLAAAISSAIRQTEAAGFTPLGIANQDLVTLSDIAQKTGRTSESVRLLASGQRGPGGFPEPNTLGRYSFYSWVQVRKWFEQNYDTQFGSGDDDVIVAADLLIRARAIADIGQFSQLWEREPLAA